MTIYDGDERMHKGKELLDRGQRLPDRRVEREYFCRTCSLQTRCIDVPSGWYLLLRANALIGQPVRLGLYCSVKCLSNMMPRLEGIERDLPADWETATAASVYTQQPTGRRWSRGKLKP